VLVCYLDHHCRGKKEDFTWLCCSATWTLLKFWPTHEKEKEEVFTWQCCFASWILLEFWPAHERRRGGFYQAVLFCYRI
jgi:hypothetical protein